MLEASKAKQEITAKVGEALDTLLEDSKSTLSKWKGSQEGLSQAIDKVSKLYEHIDMDIEDGKVELSESSLNYCRKTLQRALEIIDNLKEHSKSMESVYHGKIDAFTRAVDVAQKQHNLAVSEMRQRIAYLEELEKGELKPRTKKSGKASDLDKRRDEAAKKKSSRKKAPAKKKVSRGGG